MKLTRSVLAIVTALCAVLVMASIAAPIAAAHVVAHAAPCISVVANALGCHALQYAAVGPLLNLKPLRYEQLEGDSKPAQAGVPECYPGKWFDTQTFKSATLNTLQFFAATNSDFTLSNMQLAGQFQSGEYFKIGEIHCDLIIRPLVETAPAATNALTGSADDETQIRLTSLSNVTLTFRQKPYGPYPLTSLRPLGQPRPVVGFTGAATTGVTYTFWDAIGLLFEKQVTIPPTTKFGITVANSVSVTLIADTKMRITLRGPHYRVVS